MSEKSQLDYRLLLGECEIRESQAKASIRDYMDICEDLSRKLEEARGRIGELERELKREKKLHQQANTMRIQQMDRDSARIASLEAALTPSEETKFAYMGEVNFHHTDFDEDGNEHRIRLDVPWTSIKELMKLIREKAQSHRTAPETPGAITQATD